MRSPRIAGLFKTDASLDFGDDEVPPRWPPPRQVVAEDAVYEVAAVPMSSVALVANRTIKVRYSMATKPNLAHVSRPKVDVNAMLERRLILALKGTCSLLGELYSEWGALPHPPEVEWPRMRSLEFQEALREHEILVQRLDTFKCVDDPDFDAKVSKTSILKRVASNNHGACGAVCHPPWREGLTPAHL